MKFILLHIFFFLILTSCGNLSKSENSLNEINLETDKTTYSISDSIKIILENGSDSDIMIGIRCKTYLEMYYQKNEQDSWSDNLMFEYMSLGCPTKLDTIKPNSIFNHSIKAEIFDSTGIYRLVVNYFNPTENIEGIKYSNSFEIK